MSMRTIEVIADSEIEAKIKAEKELADNEIITEAVRQRVKLWRVVIVKNPVYFE